MKVKKYKVLFEFGDQVSTLLGKDSYIVVKILIHMDGTMQYGATDSKGEVSWFYGYEIRKAKSDESKIIGFIKE